MDLKTIVEGVALLQAAAYAYKAKVYYFDCKPRAEQLVAEGGLTQEQADRNLRKVRRFFCLPAPLELVGLGTNLFYGRYKAKISA